MWDTGTRQYYYPSPAIGDYAKCIMHIGAGGPLMSSLLSKKHDTISYCV